MVLKKSNSPFNSGATQKCFSNGVYRSMNEPSELQLTIALSGLPSIYDEKNPSWEHERALKKIYDYLGYSGPSLKQFHTSGSYYPWIKTRKSLSISLNNRGLWMIPERIDELMKETNFFEGEEEKELAEIRIQKVKKIADRVTIHNKEKRILNPKQKKKYVNPYSRIKRKMKVKVKGKKRGVQRTHLLTPTNSTHDYFGDHDDDHWIEERRRKYIDIELQEVDQMDARVLGCRQEGYTEWSKMKDNPKSKGCVNGKRAYLYKAYSAPQMRGEINRVMNSDNVWAEYDDSDIICDDIDDVGVVDEQLEDQYTYHYRNKEQIYNYFNTLASTECPTPKQKHKRGHRKDNLNTNETQLVNVNPASSQTTIKHPKGSYQVIERPRGVFKDTESTSTGETDFVIIDRDDVQVQVLDVDNSENAQELDISIPKTETPIVLNAFETRDSFVGVSLQFPKEFKDAMTESLLQSHCYSLDLHECSVLLGNCFPPVFCVSLENDWNLVGTSRSDIESFNDLEWEVTLKNTKSCSENDNVKNNFLFRLGLTNGCSVQFHDLVGMARDSVRMGLGCVANRSVLAQQVKKALASNNNSTLTYDVCTMEEVMRRLECAAYQNKKSPNSEPKTVTAGHMDIPREIVECDVCLNTCNEHGQSDTGLVTLLPCNHSFCHQCWLSHIFFHVTTGSSKISCMQTDCKEVINETALRALVPENDLAKWHRQRQERFIDTSPLCQWCPKPTCNKVSVIQEGRQHVQQFGCAVVCDCNNCYCFSCQNNPHWPMSCDQAAAYRNLLFKLGCEIPVEVTCNVELKPCPGCRYPIEKTEGCPHMVCMMCDLDFCWNCLQPADYHSVWKCTGDENSKFVTYKLHNDVKNSFPLKFFTDALGMRKKHRFVNRENVHGWIKVLERTDCKKIKLPFERSVQLEDTVLVKSKAVSLATASVSFLLDSFSFLEYFYILVSFALLNVEEEKNKSFNASTQRVIERLVHTASRLEDLVVGRSIGQLVTCESTSRMYLSTGLEMLDNLKRRVAFVQRTSRDVPAGPIGELDPTQHYRYT